MGHMGWDHHTPLAWTVNTTRAPAGLIGRSGKGYSFASLSPIRLKHIVPCQLWQSYLTVIKTSGDFLCSLPQLLAPFHPNTRVSLPPLRPTPWLERSLSVTPKKYVSQNLIYSNKRYPLIQVQVVTNFLLHAPPGEFDEARADERKIQFVQLSTPGLQRCPSPVEQWQLADRGRRLRFLPI